MVDWDTPHQIEIWPKPGGVGRNYYRYDVTYQGKTILRMVRDPELQAARILGAERGLKGWVVVKDGPTGKRRSAVAIEAAQHRYTTEGAKHGLSFKEWSLDDGPIDTG